MAMTEAQKRANKKYEERSGAKSIASRLSGSQAKAFEAYAETLGVSISSMLKDCVERCMREDGFVFEDEQESASRAAIPVIKRSGHINI